MNKLLIFIVLLFGVSSVHAWECIDFESKTVQHSVDDLFCVSYESKLTPLQMERQYNLVVDLNKQTEKYDHKIIFKTKGVLLLKSSTNEILTVEVIDPAEKEAWTEMLFMLEAQELIIDEKDLKIAALILEKEKINENYITTKSKFAEANWIIANNHTVHDQLNINEKDLKGIFKEVIDEKDKWEGRAYQLLFILIVLGINWIQGWARSNRQDGYSE